MILQITSDMKYLIIVLLIVLIGFSQAFWLISQDSGDTNSDDELAFITFDKSLVTSFSFMLGGFEADGFDGLYLESFGVLLSCVYMLIVSILLLNLLIALMGDSYAAVKEKGLAQWRFEQAQIITEMQKSVFNEAIKHEKRYSKRIFLARLKNIEHKSTEDSGLHLEQAVQDLRQAQTEEVDKKLLQLSAQIEQRLTAQHEHNLRQMRIHEVELQTKIDKLMDLVNAATLNKENGLNSLSMNNDDELHQNNL